MNFWDQLYSQGRPVVGLSPMDGVTDAPMRYMTAKYGRPDILLTEFVSVDALHFAAGERRERLLKTFIKARNVEDLHSRSVGSLHSGSVGAERWPYEVAQVFGRTPDYFKEAAELVESLGFDGIDINMGCPAHKVEENGSGAGLIRTPELAQAIVKAVKGATKLPVSVKTRIGVDREVVEEWMATLMEVGPANISLHGRTLRQLYQGSADWEAIGRAAEVVHEYGGHILGNGDVLSLADGMAKVEQYGVDGFLIGRAAEGNPGIFMGVAEPSHEQRLAWMLEHALMFERINKPTDQQTNDNKWFMPMRKHLAWYCKGFPGAVEIRSKLMQTNSANEVEAVLHIFLPS